MFLGIKNASGGPKIDIGGPCPKPYINITFWGDFFSPRGLRRVARAWRGRGAGAPAAARCEDERPGVHNYNIP